MKTNNKEITIREFVEKLAAGGGVNPLPADCAWLEVQDAALQEKALQRKTAARIIHNFLRLEVKEPDEIDGSPAYVLQDLFDCRVCAGHIIQVYVKGIMDGMVLSDGTLVFGAEEAVSEEEAEDITARVFRQKARKKRFTENMKGGREKIPEEFSAEQVIQLLEQDKTVLLVDVRTGREYEQGHLENATNVPLMAIIKNPFMFGENRKQWILFYCEEGYQSKVAAQCLMEAGYEKVAFFVYKVN